VYYHPAVRIRPGTNSSADIPARFQRLVLSPLSSSRLEVENAGPSSTTSSSVSASPSPSTSTPATAKYGKTTFTFDRVLSPDEGQQSVYEQAEPLVQSFLEGMNATILAYGQTSSGKSYTMGTDRDGGELDEEEGGEERAGIIPRAVSSVFSRLKAAQTESKGAMSFSAKVSYVEVRFLSFVLLFASLNHLPPPAYPSLSHFPSSRPPPLLSLDIARSTTKNSSTSSLATLTFDRRFRSGRTRAGI
jgi:hypothetical protein